MKVCNRCKESKPETEFYALRKDAEGNAIKRRAICRTCTREQAKTWKPSKNRQLLGPDDQLRVAPFRDWCKSRMEEDEVGIGAFAARIGMPERRLFDHLNGVSQTIPSRIVDRALTRDATGWHISQLYPSLYPGAPQAVIDLLQRVADTERIESWESDHNNGRQVAA